MKKQDCVTMMSVAVATTALSVTAFWTAPLEAGGEAGPVPAELQHPKLVAKGIEMTVTRSAEQAKSADESVFQLAAVNTGATPSEVKVRLSMTSTSPADALSRVVRLPSSFWHCDQSIVLKANEQRTYTLAARTKLPAGSIITVKLEEVLPNPPQPAPGAPVAIVERAVSMLTFATAGSELPMAKLALRD